jgi:hypothetical protein
MTNQEELKSLKRTISALRVDLEGRKTIEEELATAKKTIDNIVIATNNRKEEALRVSNRKTIGLVTTIRQGEDNLLIAKSAVDLLEAELELCKASTIEADELRTENNDLARKYDELVKSTEALDLERTEKEFDELREKAAKAEDDRFKEEIKYKAERTRADRMTDVSEELDTLKASHESILAILNERGEVLTAHKEVINGHRVAIGKVIEICQIRGKKCVCGRTTGARDIQGLAEESLEKYKI